MSAILNFQQLIPVWQALQSLAPIVHIDNEAEYAQMTDLLNCLLDDVRDDQQHPLYSLVAHIGKKMKRGTTALRMLIYQSLREPHSSISSIYRYERLWFQSSVI